MQVHFWRRVAVEFSMAPPLLQRLMPVILRQPARHLMPILPSLVPATPYTRILLSPQQTYSRLFSVGTAIIRHRYSKNSTTRANIIMVIGNTLINRGLIIGV